MCVMCCVCGEVCVCLWYVCGGVCDVFCVLSGGVLCDVWWCV